MRSIIFVHGTMCLIRRCALEAAGSWSSDTICEDTELGLTILERGWRAHYTNHRYGWGLLPQDYQAFKTQRDRWAGGAVQIVKKHWRQFLPGASLLKAHQKRAFLVGWLTWFGGESLAVAAALLNLIFVPFVACNVVALPEALLTLPVIAASAMSLLHFVVAYRLRVAVPFRHMLGAMFVSMSMQATVAADTLALNSFVQKIPILDLAETSKLLEEPAIGRSRGSPSCGTNHQSWGNNLKKTGGSGSNVGQFVVSITN